MEVEGYCKGDVCNRDGCKGILDEHEKDGCCSCHINPPCGYCTHDTTFCPECGYDAEEDLQPVDSVYDSSWYTDYRAKEEKFRNDTLAMMRREMPIDRFRCLREGHTHFSMIKKGVYPEEMTREELLKEIRGTFGGRFNRYGNGVFEYVAYTD